MPKWSVAQIPDQTGHVAIVTGATSGLGTEIADALAARGASVVLAVRDAFRGESTRQAILARQPGADLTVSTVDMADLASIRAFAERESARPAIDILINNAGLADVQPFLEMTDEAWSKVLETDLTGVWRTAQVVARRMVPRRRGSIINIASMFGLVAAKHQANYAAAKAGVIHLTRTIALELGRANVRVNAIAPGYFETEINSDFFASPAGQKYVERLFPRRLGDLSELDGPVLLLASEAGSFITGEVLAVDGGTVLKGL